MHKFKRKNWRTTGVKDCMFSLPVSPTNFMTFSNQDPVPWKEGHLFQIGWWLQTYFLLAETSHTTARNEAFFWTRTPIRDRREIKIRRPARMLSAGAHWPGWEEKANLLPGLQLQQKTHNGCCVSKNVPVKRTVLLELPTSTLQHQEMLWNHSSKSIQQPHSLDKYCSRHTQTSIPNGVACGVCLAPPNKAFPVAWLVGVWKRPPPIPPAPIKNRDKA